MEGERILARLRRCLIGLGSSFVKSNCCMEAFMKGSSDGVVCAMTDQLVMMMTGDWRGKWRG